MSVLQELRGLLKFRAVQLLFLVISLTLLAAAPLVDQSTVRDPDTWWHLKVGDWIVQQHAVPHVGIFSRTAGTRPWVAYSWGYEVLLSLSYAWFGLIGVAGLGVVLTLAVAFVLFCALHRLSGHFWIALLLSVFGSYAFLFSLMPRPVFVTMLLFPIVLTLLLEAQRTGDVRFLYWLPLVFVLWANIHIQFLYGLFTVGLFVGVNALLKLPRPSWLKIDFFEQPTLPFPRLVIVLLACFAATFAGPYSYHLYGVVREYSNSHVPYAIIQELQAFDFKNPLHYLVLLLTAAAFFALGWRKKLDLFKIALLSVAAVVAFRTARDAWFVAISAACFIADWPADEEQRTSAIRIPELAAVVTALALMLFLFARNTDFDTRGLDRTISRTYPVDAANFVRRNQLRGPLFNYLDWGGFLIWYLPQYPVTIDGRNDLYGDELDLRSFKSAQGNSYESDPDLQQAGFVLLPRSVPLASLLTIDPHYQLIYQDPIAMVFASK